MERVPFLPFIFQVAAGRAPVRIQPVGLERRNSFALGRPGVVKPTPRVLTNISERLWGKPEGRRVQILEAFLLEIEPDGGDLLGVASCDFLEPVTLWSAEGGGEVTNVRGA